MHIPSTESAPDTQPQLDALLVLGRGIDEAGELSNTSEARATMAVDLAIALGGIKKVVFSGGRSWVQRDSGIVTPSEGGGMLEVANDYIDQLPEDPKLSDILARTSFEAEEKSESTAENMAKSKEQLDLPASGGVLGLMSDKLHFSEGRPQYLAGLVFPNTEIVVFDTVPNEGREGAVSEEKLATLMSKVFFVGVSRGNAAAIMRRQHALESANRVYRSLRK